MTELLDALSACVSEWDGYAAAWSYREHKRLAQQSPMFV